MKLFENIYLRFFVKSGFPYGAYLKEKGSFHALGDNCYIAKSANIPDQYLTSLGSNVWVTSGCQLLCHDASVIMLNIMHREHFDRVAPITIGSNVFFGNNAIVLPGVTIGTGCIIGAGSVVTKDVPDNSVHAGNPARSICTLDAYVDKIKKSTLAYPWHSLLQKHAHHIYDPENEKLLRAARVKHFFGKRQ
jgi:acetyltransferase-like isoleucine patch superfamily enzyme